MGRTYTPRYAVHYRATCVLTAASWRVRRDGQVFGYGRPTDANLKKHVDHLNESFKSGGINERVGNVYIYGARIVDQTTGDVVARYQAPAFQVI